MDKFDKICKDIKSLKIQGAENIAIEGVKALLLKHDSESIKKIISTRPTEPALRNAVNFAKPNPKKLVPKVLRHFQESKKKIIKFGKEKIKDGDIVYTHCHSSTVIAILEAAWKKGKRFEVHNTETRPMYQGRITATELANKLKIPVKHYVDSAARFALKRADIMLIGADAISMEKGGRIINKIGSEMIAEVAESYSVPVYVATNSWKFDPLTIYGYEHIEKRPSSEVWKGPPKGVEIINIAFEKIDANLVEGIISEFGTLKFHDLINKLRGAYPWMFKI